MSYLYRRSLDEIDIECCRNYNSWKMTGFYFLLSRSASAPNLFPNNVLLEKSARLVKTRPVCQVWWCLVLYNCGSVWYWSLHLQSGHLTTGHCVLCNYQRLGTLAWYCDMVAGVTRSQTSRHAALTSPVSPPTLHRVGSVIVPCFCDCQLSSAQHS